MINTLMSLLANYLFGRLFRRPARGTTENRGCRCKIARPREFAVYYTTVYSRTRRHIVFYYCSKLLLLRTAIGRFTLSVYLLRVPPAFRNGFFNFEPRSRYAYYDHSCVRVRNYSSAAAVRARKRQNWPRPNQSVSALRFVTDFFRASP